MRAAATVSALAVFVQLTPISAFADGDDLSAPPSEIVETMKCGITGTAIIAGQKRTVDFKGSETGNRITFHDGHLKYRIDMIFDYTIGSSSTKELMLTRIDFQPGELPNRTFQHTRTINHWIPFGAKGVTVLVSNGIFRNDHKDAQTTLIHDMNPDPAKATADASETIAHSPGVTAITTKLLGPNPAAGGVRVLAETLSCDYAPSTGALVPKASFFSAVPNELSKFRAQFEKTVAAEAEAKDCTLVRSSDCDRTAERAKQSLKARDALWQILFFDNPPKP